MHDLIVLGGGPAGATAALRARELGADVALVERGALGGTCTNDGCVPTRVLAHTARLIRDAEQYSTYGLHGGSPELDFPDLLARTRDVVARIHQKKRLRAHLEGAGARVLAGVGPARFRDAHTDGFCKLIVSQANHRILGAHIVGEQAVEILQLVAAGMAADLWVEQIAELELAYPTFTAVVDIAARQLVRELGVLPLAPQWRHLGQSRAAEWERHQP